MDNFALSKDVKPQVEVRIGQIDVVSNDDIHNAEMVEEIKVEALSPGQDLQEDEDDRNLDSCPSFQISGLLQQLDVSRDTSVLHRKPADVFCLGVTGLFFKCLPNKMRYLMGEKCRYGELSHDRFTVLLSTNMDGSEKLPLLCVGSPDNGKFARNLSSSSLEYISNLKSFLTAKIFNKWLRKLNTHFESQNRKVTMLINKNFISNIQIRYSHINLVFLPTNKSGKSNAQPFDHGIARQFKLHYRYILLRSYVAYLEYKEKMKGENLSSKLCTQNNVHGVREEVKGRSVRSGQVESGSEKYDGHHTQFEWSVTDSLYAVRRAWRRLELSVVQEAFDGAGIHLSSLANQNAVESDVEDLYSRLMKRLNSLLAKRWVRFVSKLKYSFVS